MTLIWKTFSWRSEHGSDDLLLAKVVCANRLLHFHPSSDRIEIGWGFGKCHLNLKKSERLHLSHFQRRWQMEQKRVVMSSTSTKFWLFMFSPLRCWHFFSYIYCRSMHIKTQQSSLFSTWFKAFEMHTFKNACAEIRMCVGSSHNLRQKHKPSQSFALKIFSTLARLEECAMSCLFCN